MDEDVTFAVRRFSRFYTRRLGLLQDGLLGSPFPLADARVLFELGCAGETGAARLGRELSLDPGYLSRILKGFEARGLVIRTPSETDGRQVSIVLTEAGRAAFATIDSASRAAVDALLTTLDATARARLVASLDEAARLLGDVRPTGAVTVRDLAVGDVGWIARRQGLLYAAEYGWDATFEALVAEIAAAFVRTHDPARERAWIAERDGAILGSLFLVRDREAPEGDAVAKLRLLYVEPDARGLGLGGRLVDACLAYARERGYRRVVLWTNDVLVAARRLYQARGFVLLTEERHRSFGKDLVGQNWALDL